VFITVLTTDYHVTLASAKFMQSTSSHHPMPEAARSTAWVYDRSLAGITGCNPDGGMNVVCCQVDVSATDRPLVQRNPTECLCVTECEQVQQ